MLAAQRAHNLATAVSIPETSFNSSIPSSLRKHTDLYSPEYRKQNEENYHQTTTTMLRRDATDAYIHT